MAKSDEGSPILSWSGLVVLLVSGYALWTVRPDLLSQRPRAEEVSDASTLAPNTRWSRLWEDPFGVVSRSDGGADLNKGLDGAMEALKERRKKTLRICPVFADERPFADASETRLRLRYAVLSAMGAAGYVPDQTDRIRFLSLPIEPHHRLARIPYEILTSVGGGDGLLVVWLPEDQLGEMPLRNLQGFLKLLELPTDGGVSIFGPSSSDTLSTLLREASSLRAGELSGFTLYSDRATIADRDLQLTPTAAGQGASALRHPEWTIGASGLKLIRTIGSDDLLAKQLADELILRELHLDEPSNEIILLAEWDSKYGRAWKDLFQNAVAARVKSAGQHATVKVFSYLRGLDGKGASVSGDGSAADSKERKGSQEKSWLSGSPPSEPPHGTAQFDYVRRLEQEIKESARGSSGRICAVGVVGSDVYDKLILIRAFRRAFPQALFFTTDLDARYFHPSEIESTRNLITSSHFNLALSDTFQDGIPPFRDSYQTSTFYAVRRALNPDRFSGIPIPEARTYEISKDSAVDLSIAVPNATVEVHPRSDREGSVGRLLLLSVWILAELALACLVLAPLFASFFAIYPQGKRLIVFKRAASAFVVAYLAMAVAIAVDSTKAEGEPFSLLGGISVWPTEMIRAFCILLGIWFLVTLPVKLAQNITDLELDYPGMKPPAGPKEPRGLKKALEDVNNWKLEGDVEARTIWKAHLIRMGRYQSLLRAVPASICFLVFLVALFMWGGTPLRPVRGSFCARLDAALLFVDVLLLVLLLFLVIDATRATTQFGVNLRIATVRWPHETLVHFFGDSLPKHQSANELISIRFLADRTEAVGKLMYYPFIMLLLMLVARNRIFDNWGWNTPLVVTFVLTGLGAVYCGILLRVEAERARGKSLEDVAAELIQLTGTATTPETKAQVEQVKAIQADIASNKTGAFCPLYEDPLIHAVLIPLGGVGTMELLRYSVGMF